MDTKSDNYSGFLEPPKEKTPETHILNLRATIHMRRDSVFATGWTVGGSNPGGGQIFRTPPDRPWGPPSLLSNGYWVSFVGVKRPGHDVQHPLPSSTEVKKKEYSYTSTPPLGPRGLF